MACSKMLSSTFAVVVASLTLSSASANGLTNDTIIPNYFCDLQYGAIEYINNCTMTLLPEKPAAVIASKVADFMKNATMADFVADVCVKSPKLFSSSFRAIIGSVEKEFQRITKIILHTCWNATIYWLPTVSETRYKDIGLYFH